MENRHSRHCAHRVHKYALGVLDVVTTSSIHDKYSDRGTWQEAAGGALGGGTLGAIAAELLGRDEDRSYFASRGAVVGGALGLTGALTDPEKAVNMATGGAVGGGVSLLAAHLAANLLNKDADTTKEWAQLAGGAGLISGVIAGKSGMFDIKDLFNSIMNKEI